MLSFIKKNIVYILIFLIALTVRCAAISQKDYIFIDTPFSFISSTPTNLSPEGKIFKKSWDIYDFEKGKNYHINEIKKSLFEVPKSFKSIKNDLIMIRNNNIERQHSNLYYSIFRIWTAGFDGLYFKEMIIRGCSLNLIFFALSFFFLFKLLSLIKDDKKFISIGLFLGFLNNAGISNTILIREYALLEAMFLGAVYFSLKLYKLTIEGKDISTKDVIFSSLIYALFALSGYFSLIYLLFIGLGAYVLAIIYKKNLQKIFYILITSYLLILLFYPSFFDFISNNEHFYTIIDKISGIGEGMEQGIFAYIALQLHFLIKSFFQYCIYLPVFISIVTIYLLSLIFPKIKDNNKLSSKEYLIIISLISFAFIGAFISIYIAPYQQIRYILPSAGIMCFIGLLILYRLKNICFFVVAIFYLIFCTIPIYKNISDYQNIVYLHKLTYEHTDEYENIEKLPVVVVGQPGWYVANYFVYFPRNTIIRFEDNIPNDNFEFKKYYIICSDFEPVDKNKFGFINDCYDTSMYIKIDKK